MERSYPQDWIQTCKSFYRIFDRIDFWTRMLKKYGISKAYVNVLLESFSNHQLQEVFKLRWRSFQNVELFGEYDDFEVERMISITTFVCKDDKTWFVTCSKIPSDHAKLRVTLPEELTEEEQTEIVQHTWSRTPMIQRSVKVWHLEIPEQIENLLNGKVNRSCHRMLWNRQLFRTMLDTSRKARIQLEDKLRCGSIMSYGNKVIVHNAYLLKSLGEYPIGSLMKILIFTYGDWSTCYTPDSIMRMHFK